MVSSFLVCLLDVTVILMLQDFKGAAGAVLTDKWPILCPSQTFYSKKQGLCLECSKCPVNRIITSPCIRFQDTKCGPFFSLNRHHSAEDNDKKTKDKDLLKLYDVSGINMETITVKPTTVHRYSSSQLEQRESYFDFDVWDRWKTLTVVICVAIILLVVVVLVVGIWLVRKKLVRHKKLLKCQYSPPPVQV